jgi:hypothetical protein
LLSKGNIMRDLTVIAQSGAEVVNQAVRQLQRAGFDVRRSFDLQTTRAFQSGCSCPHHGTALCNCQYAVLLVQSPDGSLLTLLAHGRDGLTWFSLADDPEANASGLMVEEVKRLLQQAAAVEMEEIRIEEATNPV